MTQPVPFSPVKLICGVISSNEEIFERAKQKLQVEYGRIDSQSPKFDFDATDYYQKDMGQNLMRKFIGFESLIRPEELSRIKWATNSLEEQIRQERKTAHRVVNLDPGFITTAALIMATAKNFSHRIPLQRGIYAHLELLFRKNDIVLLEWTYPDFRKKGYQEYFISVRKSYLRQLRK